MQTPWPPGVKINRGCPSFARRRTKPCSARPAPKREPTSSRLCFIWRGVTPGGLSFEYFSFATSLRLIFPSFRREVKKNVKLRRQSESEVKLSSSNPKKTFNGCCGLWNRVMKDRKWLLFPFTNFYLLRYSTWALNVDAPIKMKFSTHELAHNSNNVFMRLLIKWCKKKICRMMHFLHFRACFALGHLFLKVKMDTYYFLETF